MTVIRAHARVGSDGNVTVPVGIDEVGTEVEVVVTPAKPPLSEAEYKAILARTAGSIPDLEQPPRWEYAKREPLE